MNGDETTLKPARGIDRRNLLKLTAIGVTSASAASFGSGLAVAASDNDAWDKVFPKSDKVQHSKISFQNQYGIDVSADLYVPADLDRSKRHAALVVGHPYGGTKEQTSGLYAQTMAERGYVTVAHDASYNGESGGEPRAISPAEIWVEDFSAAVDYLGQQSFVDRNRIGVIGVCGGGGFGLAAAAVDPRIKAIATVVMYDIGQGNRQGLSEEFNLEAHQKSLSDIAERRWVEVDGAEPLLVGAMPKSLPADPHPVLKEFWEYYGTPRGFHPRATTGMTMISRASMTMFWSFDKLPWISPRPVLFVTGENAHSRHFSQQAFEHATEPKELLVVPGAGHVDLYDRVDLIPWDALDTYFEKHLV